MKLRGGKTIRHALLSVVCLCLLATMTFAAATKGQTSNGQKATVTGTIISRDGNLVKIKDKNVKALVPGLIVKAKGVRNADGQLEARKITFTPDAFEVAVAQQQQIMDNEAAVGRAQTTADLGLDNAATAQSSANKAQSTA